MCMRLIFISYPYKESYIINQLKIILNITLKICYKSQQYYYMSRSIIGKM